ncbi:MAG: hypothetical protein H0T18_07695, partial [Chloroflexia bacterium]|nr:hypothetical protein [Chloroflexia bacterium]
MNDCLAPGYAARRPNPSDAAAVHALIVASDLAEFGESSGYGLDEIENDWTRTDLTQDAWVVFGARGELAGYGFIEQRRYVRHDVEIYV